MFSVLGMGGAERVSTSTWVMKCVLDGKQAAILVPTTVLAQQHYATAMGRFRDWGT